MSYYYCHKYYTLGPVGIGFYRRMEFSFDRMVAGVYRLSLGFITITYWR